MITNQSGWHEITPTHWATKRLKDVGVGGLINGIFKTKDQFGSGVRLVNVGDLYQDSSVIDNEKLDRVKATTSEIDRYQVLDGDIFFVRSSLKLEGVGVSAIFENNTEPTVFECHVIRYRPNQKKIFPKFAIYQLNSNEIKRKLIVVSKTVTMTTISQDKISTIDIAYPSLEEQQAIADYLDAKTAQIDRKIDLLEQKAEKYADLKQSLINETVTCGLDKTVPMKDSGVKWISQIPEHWTVKRIKEVSSIVNGATPKSNVEDNWDGDIAWVTPDDLGKLSSKFIVDTKRKITKAGFDSCGTTMCPVGSIVISSRAPIGYIGMLSVEACTNQGCKTLVLNMRLTNKDFMFYCLVAARKMLEVLGKGTTFTELSTKELSLFALPLPPLAEQKVVTEYLDMKTVRIEKIIEAINLEVEKLKELRKTLINDVVTGKIKVYEETIHE